MKRILAPILLMTLLFPSLALGEGIKYGDLVERDGIHYKKFTEVPFTGKTTGQIQGTFRNGKKDGPWVTYYNTGQLFFKGTYKDGKQDGLWVSYQKNGELIGKGNWRDGKKDGRHVVYNKDGTIWDHFTGTYKNGKKVSD